MILQIEWMTQRHYLDSMVDNENLDPQFKSLLKHHWMEESHTPSSIHDGSGDQPKPARQKNALSSIDGYLEIGGMIDAALDATSAVRFRESEARHRPRVHA